MIVKWLKRLVAWCLFSIAVVNFAGNGVLSASAWLDLGISRNLRISGRDSDPNNMNLSALGYGFNR